MKPTNIANKKDIQPINKQIRAAKVQLILDEGTNVGVVPIAEALQKAAEAGLDLVQIALKGKDDIPVVKIMDFGKSLYEKKKKSGEAKKHQKVILVKEVKISPKIGEHDFQIKMKQAVQFINDGKRVKISLFFRGREAASKQERGTELFEKVNQIFQAHGLSADLVQEEDTNSSKLWSRIFYLKTSKK